MNMRRHKKRVWCRCITDPSVINGYDNHVRRSYVRRWTPQAVRRTP